MRIASFVGGLAAVCLIVPSALPVEAAERRTSVRRAVVPKQQAPDRSQSRVDSSDSWRAHDADPAGNYKNYPDWARTALGSRSSSR